MNIVGMYRKCKIKLKFLSCIFFLQLNKLIVLADTKGKSTETSGAAGDIGSSKLVTGTIKLCNDVSSALLIIAPLLGSCFLAYFFVRKNGADDTDQKQWDKRIKITFVCVIGAFVASGVLNTVTGYYM